MKRHVSVARWACSTSSILQAHPDLVLGPGKTWARETAGTDMKARRDAIAEVNYSMGNPSTQFRDGPRAMEILKAQRGVVHRGGLRSCKFFALAGVNLIHTGPYSTNGWKCSLLGSVLIDPLIRRMAAKGRGARSRVVVKRSIFWHLPSSDDVSIAQQWLEKAESAFFTSSCCHSSSRSPL